MFIRELQITNFKSFNGPSKPIQFNLPEGTLGSGLNVLVGENNTGKSTLFEAIDFLRNGTKKNLADIRNKNSQDEATVEITFEGDINAVIEGFSQDNKVKVFKRYIYQTAHGADSFKASRSTEDAKQIKFWNAGEMAYGNETGIDAPFKKLFEANFVWADTNPNEEATFGSTTICGNLLREIANSFTETDEYQGFRDKFNETFNSEGSGLRKQLLEIEEKVQRLFNEQFGAARISFHFEELKVDSFFKSTSIKVDDGIETPMHEKGNGMQRAVALALLQVYAEELTKHPDDSNLKKPFFLFIDEPEICLHPKAQERLMNALLEISRTKQVFITTHSPYFLSSAHLKGIGLHLFRNEGNTSVAESASLHPLLPWSPSWGEINYKAYKLPTVEFHNELYGYLQEKHNLTHQIDFEKWMAAQGKAFTKTWIRERNGVPQTAESVTLHTFIRNKIHHPENTTMQSINYSQDELDRSIQEMIALLYPKNSLVS